jgi:hypothetical protein
MIMRYHDGRVSVPEMTKDSTSKWSDVYAPNSWEQKALEEALATIEANPSKKPPRQPAMYEIGDCDLTAEIVLQAAYHADDRRARYCYGWIRGAEIAQVARVLSEQRPKRNEDVVYWRGVGVRMSLRKGTDDLITVSPGLIESFVWNGEFGLANPLWPTSIMGLGTLASGQVFAKALAAQGVECDADALDVLLDFGLRAELLAAASQSE